MIQFEDERLDSNRGVMRGRKRKIVKENEQRKGERANEFDVSAIEANNSFYH